MDAIVLAASPNNGALQTCHAASMEALIPIGERPMVDYVVRALLQTRGIERLIVVGPTDLNQLYDNAPEVIVVEGGVDPLSSLQRGLSSLPSPSPMLLIATGDLPLITPKVVENFLCSCAGQSGDVYYPIVRREDNEKKYPGVRRTYVHLREGEFTGGNLFLVNSRIVVPAIERARDFVRLRKDPIALSRLLGWRFAIRFLLRRLSLEEAQRRVSDILGICGVGIISSDPEVGVDVDKPSDLELARQLLC